MLPRKWVIPVAQVGIAGLLLVFWFLFQTKAEWVSVGFYFLGLIMGILLISQFWTLANEIYDPRQAKRVFGFIGGGVEPRRGDRVLVLTSLVVDHRPDEPAAGQRRHPASSAPFIVVAILRRESNVELEGVVETGEEGGVPWTEAFLLLKSSKHLQIIAMVIGFAAIGAAIIEQQLNMAAAEFAKGGTDLEKILGQVQLLLSLIGFVVQVWLTSQIHRYLGIGFALLILPVSLGTTGARHAVQQGAVGADDGAHQRHVAALHGRQDDARDPVPAAALRPEERAPSRSSTSPWTACRRASAPC